MARLPLIEAEVGEERDWLDPVRIGEVFRKQPRFVCPDCHSLRWTLLSTVLPGMTFVRYFLPLRGDLESDDYRHGVWSRALCLVWAVVALVGLVAAACRNPGVVPRAPPVREDQRIPTPQPRYVIVNGVQVRQRWCTTCRVYRPLRSKHCSYCDRCVFRFDHHCTWLGNCVGLGNYRSFLVLVVAAALFFAHSASIALEVLCLDMREGGSLVGSDRGASPRAGHSREEVLQRLFVANAGKLIYIVYAAIMFLAFLVLILYHAIIMRCNLTTNEHVRDYYLDRNPFDISCWDNYRQILCAPCSYGLLSQRSSTVGLAATSRSRGKVAHPAAAPCGVTVVPVTNGARGDSVARGNNGGMQASASLTLGHL